MADEQVKICAININILTQVISNLEILKHKNSRNVTDLFLGKGNKSRRIFERRKTTYFYDARNIPSGRKFT